MNGNEGQVSTLRVDLGERSYDIHLGEGVLESAGQRMRPLLAQDR